MPADELTHALRSELYDPLRRDPLRRHRNTIARVTCTRHVAGA